MHLDTSCNPHNFLNTTTALFGCILIPVATLCFLILGLLYVWFTGLHYLFSDRRDDGYPQPIKTWYQLRFWRTMKQANCYNDRPILHRVIVGLVVILSFLVAIIGWSMILITSSFFAIILSFLLPLIDLFLWFLSLMYLGRLACSFVKYQI